MLFRSIFLLSLISMVVINVESSNLTEIDYETVINNQFLALTLLDIKILPRDETPESIEGLCEANGFLDKFRQEILENTETDGCLLVSFPTKDGSNDLYYGNELPKSALHFKPVIEGVQRMVYRNSTEDWWLQEIRRRKTKMARARRLKDNRDLFVATCRQYAINVANGCPLIPIYVSKLEESSEPMTWIDRIKNRIVPNYAKENETHGLLVVLSEFATPKRTKNQKVREVRGTIFDLSNTSEPIWEGDRNHFITIAEKAVGKIKEFVQARLTECQYKMRKTSCYYRRLGDCQRRFIREPILNETDPHSGYCMQGSRLVEDQICHKNPIQCDQTCDDFTIWTECNDTCDGYTWRRMQIPDGADMHLELCPIVENRTLQQMKRCSPDCVPPTPSAVTISMIVLGVFLVVSPFFCLVIGYVCFCTGSPVAPKSSRISKKSSKKGKPKGP